MNKLNNTLSNNLPIIVGTLIALSILFSSTEAKAQVLQERTTIDNMSFTLGYDVDVDVYDTYISITMQDARFQVINKPMTILIMNDSIRLQMIEDLTLCINSTQKNDVNKKYGYAPSSTYYFYNLRKSSGKLNKKQIGVRLFETSSVFSYMTTKQAVRLVALLERAELN